MGIRVVQMASMRLFSSGSIELMRFGVELCGEKLGGSSIFRERKLESYTSGGWAQRPVISRLMNRRD